ncbi:MAG: hypothetical protein Q9191_007730 [Dirinaria sp. TL-2023a]
MPKEHFVQKREPQMRMDTYGCGAQFSQKDGRYPQPKDIDRYLSSRQKHLDRPIALPKEDGSSDTRLRARAGKEEKQYIPVCRDMGKYSGSKDIEGSGVSQIDPMLMCQHAPSREMPWDGVAAAGQSRDMKDSGRGGRSGNVSFVGATKGNSQEERSKSA